MTNAIEASIEMRVTSTVPKTPPSPETIPVASKDTGTEVSEAAMTNAIEASIERRV
jgi:hypothetical protein